MAGDAAPPAPGGGFRAAAIAKATGPTGVRGNANASTRQGGRRLVQGKGYGLHERPWGTNSRYPQGSQAGTPQQGHA